MAIDDAQLNLQDWRSQPGVISVGTTDGESSDLDHMVEAEILHGPEQLAPELARRVPAGRLSAAIAQELERVAAAARRGQLCPAEYEHQHEQRLSNMTLAA